MSFNTTAESVVASSCSDAEHQWMGPFCFIQAADPQLGLMKAWRDGDCDSGGEEWAEEVELTKQAVEAVNQLRPRPRFMVLCGDLVHAMPGREWAQKERAQHLNTSNDQMSTTAASYLIKFWLDKSELEALTGSFVETQSAIWSEFFAVCSNTALNN